MPKAGPLTRSASKHVIPAETLAVNNRHADVMQAPSNAQSPQSHAELRHRLHSADMVIGLALGSPSQSPTLAMSLDDRGVIVPCVCSSPANSASMFENKYENSSGSKTIKRKGSKWKTLGSYIGRKQVRSVSPFYQLDPKQQPEPATQLTTPNQLETNAFRRKRAGSRHGSRVLPVCSYKGTYGEESSGLLRKTSSRRRGLRRRKFEEPQPKMQRIPVEYTACAIAEDLDPHGEQQGSWIPGSSLLQVEIPCVELERYSVMFGDVLKPQARRNERQPSLSSHLVELHTIADSKSKSLDSASPEAGMRADSMTLKYSKSSSFSLFPSTPPHSTCSPVNKLPLKLSPLSCSSTGPSRRLPPPKPAIKESKPKDQDHILVIRHKSEAISEESTSRDRELSSNPSQRSANSTTASLSECTEYPRYSSPAIEADTPTPTEVAPQGSLRRAFPARKSSMKSPASPELPYKHQQEDPIGSAAEVSVARQISISRRQRQFLVPIAPKTTRHPIQPGLDK